MTFQRQKAFCERSKVKIKKVLDFLLEVTFGEVNLDVCNESLWTDPNSWFKVKWILNVEFGRCLHIDFDNAPQVVESGSLRW